MIIPAIFSWWLFVPIALVYVYLAKFPYEIILAGLMLDTLYYFGEGFIWRHPLALSASALIVLAFFVDKAVRWQKRI